MFLLPRFLRRSSASAAFPVELVREILSFAGTASLAACCRVNWAFLEIASEILYQDVEVVGLERLRRLFNAERGTSPRVDSLLSLRQIRTFTFIAEAHAVKAVPVLLTRRRGRAPLEIDNLVVQVYSNGPPFAQGTPPIVINRTLHTLLYPHFDPRVIRFHSQRDPLYRLGLQPVFNSFITSPNGQQEWTRLKSLQLVQAYIQPLPAWREQWVVSSSPGTGQLSVELPVVFRTGSRSDLPSPELSIMVQAYVGVAPLVPVERGPGRAFRRFEIVVGSEGDRLAVNKFIKEQADRGGAVGGARIQNELDADELAVVVKDLSNIHVIKASQEPLSYNVTPAPAPGSGRYVLPPPASVRPRRPRTQTERDGELRDLGCCFFLVLVCGGSALMIYLALNWIFPYCFELLRLLLSYLWEVPDYRFGTTEWVVGRCFVVMALREIVAGFAIVAGMNDADAVRAIPVPVLFVLWLIIDWVSPLAWVLR